MSMILMALLAASLGDPAPSDPGRVEYLWALDPESGLWHRTKGNNLRILCGARVGHDPVVVAKGSPDEPADHLRCEACVAISEGRSVPVEPVREKTAEELAAEEELQRAATAERARQRRLEEQLADERRRSAEERRRLEAEASARKEAEAKAKKAAEDAKRLAVEARRREEEAQRKREKEARRKARNSSAGL